MSSFYGNCGGAAAGGGGGGSTGLGTATFETHFDEEIGDFVIDTCTTNGLTSFETYLNRGLNSYFCEPAVSIVKYDNGSEGSYISDHVFDSWGTGYVEQFIYELRTYTYTGSGIPEYTSAAYIYYRIRYSDGRWGDWIFYESLF